MPKALVIPLWAVHDVSLVKKVIHNIVVKNMEGVLGAIKARAESPD